MDAEQLAVASMGSRNDWNAAMESPPDRQLSDLPVLDYARAQPDTAVTHHAGMALLGCAMALFLAPTFKCGCGYLDWPGLFVTVPACGLTVYAWVRNQSRNLVWRAFLMIVVVGATMILFKNIADVLWFGHRALLP